MSTGDAAPDAGSQQGRRPQLEERRRVKRWVKQHLQTRGSQLEYPQVIARRPGRRPRMRGSQQGRHPQVRVRQQGKHPRGRSARRLNPLDQEQ